MTRTCASAHLAVAAVLVGLIGACSEKKSPAPQAATNEHTWSSGLSADHANVPSPDRMGFDDARAVPPVAIEPHAMSPHDQLLDEHHVGSFVWTDAQWHSRCRGVRTSYDPDHDLREDELTLVPSDPRWLDFVFWTLSSKVNEHQVEAYGGTNWNGPKGGIIFHWAPGSRWERDTLHSVGFFIGHVVGEHRWTDTMFPDFFEKYGGVYGVNVKDRLAEIEPRSMRAWVDFLAYQAGPSSPYYRYLLHIYWSVDVDRRLVSLAAGQGVGFNYSFERLYHELAMILTDCKAVEFFEMYDRFGPGFAAEGNWAKQHMPSSALSRIGYANRGRYAGGSGWGGATSWARPTGGDAPRIVVPSDLRDADRMRHGEAVYFAQCVDCHGAKGDGAGFLAEGFDVKPRDFRQAKYKFRSTASGELPTIADVERTVRDGVPGTTMPAWSQFLTEQEIGDVARYLIPFSPRFVDAWRARRSPQALSVARPPPEVEEVSAHPTGDLQPCLRPSGAAYAASLPCRGEQLWNLHQCRWCHGDDARGDGPTARGMTDDWHHSIRPANLTYKWLFKNGHLPEEVYRSIFGGLDGTPMGSYASKIADERDRWAIVAYVLSMSPPSRPVLHLAEFAHTRASRIGPDGLVAPAAPTAAP
jgi:cytochrome c oxidase cbb3-type subunit 2